MALVKVRGRLKTAACTLTKMLLDVFFPCHLFLLFFGISDIIPQHPFLLLIIVIYCTRNKCTSKAGSSFMLILCQSQVVVDKVLI